MEHYITQLPDQNWLPSYYSIFIYACRKSTIIIPVYVNNKLLAGNNNPLLDSIQSSIGSHFKSSNLSTTLWILGICVHHNIKDHMLFIEQSQYLKGVLSCYGMTRCMPVSTPLPPNSQFLPATPDEHAEVSSYPYLKAIGSLMYAAMGTCLDISYAI